MCVGFCCDDVPPSPNAHAYEAIVPSGSLPDPVKVTGRGAVPEVGVADAVAVGGWLLVAEMPTVLEPVAPPLSVTVSVAVKLPGEA